MKSAWRHKILNRTMFSPGNVINDFFCSCISAGAPGDVSAHAKTCCCTMFWDSEEPKILFCCTMPSDSEVPKTMVLYNNVLALQPPNTL